jgi:hypothetical protein
MKNTLKMKYNYPEYSNLAKEKQLTGTMWKQTICFTLLRFTPFQITRCKDNAYC